MQPRTPIDLGPALHATLKPPRTLDTPKTIRLTDIEGIDELRPGMPLVFEVAMNEDVVVRRTWMILSVFDHTETGVTIEVIDWPG